MKIKGSKIFTCQALHDKEKRSLAILEMIRKKGLVSRTDISRATGINVVSVSNYISSFIEKKLVLEKGHAASSGGRKPELVELNAKENFCVGVDMRADNISAILVDIGMNVIAKKKVPRPEKKREVASAVVSLIEETIKSSGVLAESIRSIVIGVYCESLLPVSDEVEKKFGIGTFLGGAASCAAYAEKRLNPDAAVEKLLYVHSDIGRSTIIDGDICTGCIGDPGEMEVPENTGRADESEPYADKLKYLNPWSPYLGMVETAKREVARGVGTKIVSLSGGDIEKITEAVVIDAARQNDETALNIVQGVSINMGLRIAYLINLFGPEAVVVGGGLEKAQDLTFPFIDKMVKRLSLKKYNNAVRIVPSSLGEEGLCLGASALAVREVFLKA